MRIRELILRNRSFRRFDESYRVSEKTLEICVDLARCSPSARNAQPIKYYLSIDKEQNERIFPTLAWAGYLKDWPGPAEGERPTAYIVMLGDTRITTNYYCDHGIAAQSILLGAVAQGLGGCIIAAVKREKLHEILKLPDYLEILQVIAIGKPAEKVKIENINESGDYKYYRDENDVHHVPKRTLNEIIISGPAKRKKY